MGNSRSVPQKAVIIAGAATVLVAVVLVAGFLIGTALFSNEMACYEGEVPANNTEGGSACFKEGAQLPPGFTWDVRGNYKIN